MVAKLLIRPTQLYRQSQRVFTGRLLLMVPTNLSATINQLWRYPPFGRSASGAAWLARFDPSNNYDCRHISTRNDIEKKNMTAWIAVITHTLAFSLPKNNRQPYELIPIVTKKQSCSMKETWAGHGHGSMTGAIVVEWLLWDRHKRPGIVIAYELALSPGIYPNCQRLSLSLKNGLHGYWVTTGNRVSCLFVCWIESDFSHRWPFTDRKSVV